MNNTELELLKIIADMDGTPDGAYNIRANSGLADRRVTENIDIKTKTDKSGIDIIIKPNTKGEKVHIPVIISESGLTDRRAGSQYDEITLLPSHSITVKVSETGVDTGNSAHCLYTLDSFH